MRYVSIFNQPNALGSKGSEGGLASPLAQVVNIWVRMLSDITTARLLSRELSQATGRRTASPHTAVTKL